MYKNMLSNRIKLKAGLVSYIFICDIISNIYNWSGLGISAGTPFKTAIIFLAVIIDISSRVSIAALPIWGSITET